MSVAPLPKIVKGTNDERIGKAQGLVISKLVQETDSRGLND